MSRSARNRFNDTVAEGLTSPITVSSAPGMPANQTVEHPGSSGSPDGCAAMREISASGSGLDIHTLMLRKRAHQRPGRE